MRNKMDPEYLPTLEEIGLAALYDKNTRGYVMIPTIEQCSPELRRHFPEIIEELASDNPED